MNQVILHTERGEAILRFNAQFTNDKLDIYISCTSFADFLDGLQARTLREVNISLQIELENKTGHKTVVDVAIPLQLLDKTATELREMDSQQ